ncbi:capZ-interacting protein [Platysternon megacephalum]|uniref:CapZ-interacting protein n=1 Tax=Platysternon megacephalum TaxID=55544 RepID=A0A4D9EIA8_9SAUR|nr:capZ-interacting protein [Platysternon megacephalum]
MVGGANRTNKRPVPSGEGGVTEPDSSGNSRLPLSHSIGLAWAEAVQISALFLVSVSPPCLEGPVQERSSSSQSWLIMIHRLLAGRAKPGPTLNSTAFLCLSVPLENRIQSILSLGIQAEAVPPRSLGQESRVTGCKVRDLG